MTEINDATKSESEEQPNRFSILISIRHILRFARYLVALALEIDATEWDAEFSNRH